MYLFIFNSFKLCLYVICEFVYEKGVCVLRFIHTNCLKSVLFLLHRFWRLNSGFGLVYQMPLSTKTSASLRKVNLT